MDVSGHDRHGPRLTMFHHLGFGGMSERTAFALMVIDYDNTHPIAVYSDKEQAEAEARRLEAAHARTNPAFSDWCNRRWSIVLRWRREERELNDFGLPTDKDEAVIRSMIGECPPLDGHESCDVWEVADRRP